MGSCCGYLRLFPWQTEQRGGWMITHGIKCHYFLARWFFNNCNRPQILLYLQATKWICSVRPVCLRKTQDSWVRGGNNLLFAAITTVRVSALVPVPKVKFTEREWRAQSRAGDAYTW